MKVQRPDKTVAVCYHGQCVQKCTDPLIVHSLHLQATSNLWGAVPSHHHSSTFLLSNLRTANFIKKSDVFAFIFIWQYHHVSTIITSSQFHYCKKISWELFSTRFPDKRLYPCSVGAVRDIAYVTILLDKINSGFPPNFFSKTKNKHIDHEKNVKQIKETPST